MRLKGKSRSPLQSLRQAHAAQQVREARVGAQGVPDWIHFEVREEKRALLIRLFEPRESLVLLAQPEINDGEGIGRHVLLLRGPLELVENPERLASLT